MALSHAAFLLAAGLLVAPPANAAEPVLKHLFPVAGQQGTTVSLTATGTFETWPPQVWTDAPGLIFEPAVEKGKLTVEIANDAAPGPHLVRFFTPQGASAPRFFIVSTEPALLETEPNDDFKAPQKIESLPVSINGRLDKQGDVDCFAVTLKQGQPLTASVEAYVLGSPFDGLLRIVDGEGTELAFNHDGRTLDPLLAWTAPRDGTFFVQLMGFIYPPGSSVSFAGNENCLYRLHLTSDPPPRAALLPPTLPDHAEQEPNNIATEAATIGLPGSVSGAIQQAGDEDRFAFSAQQGATYNFDVMAARSGSPLNAWLKIESRTGALLARKDGLGAARDPQLTWKAPATAVFIAALGDLTHQGGSDYFYRLSLKEATPSVTATTAIHSLVVSPDKGAELKVSVKRSNGFQTKLQLVALDLPAGITATEVDVPDKDGDVTIQFTAAEGAEPISQPLHIVLRERVTETEYAVRYFLPALVEPNASAGSHSDLLIESTETLWLAYPGQPEPNKS